MTDFDKTELNDLKWKFIEKFILEAKDNKISEHDISLIYKYTEFLKKELRI